MTCTVYINIERNIWVILQPVVLSSYFIIVDIYHNKSTQLFIKALEWFATHNWTCCVNNMQLLFDTRNTLKEDKDRERGIRFSLSKNMYSGKWSTSSIPVAQQSALSISSFNLPPMFLSFCTVLSNKGKMPPEKWSLSCLCQGTLHLWDTCCCKRCYKLNTC